MNKKYIAVALYHTVIHYQLEMVIDALENLGEYNPIMYEVSALMKEVDKELENEGRQLLKEIEKEC